MLFKILLIFLLISINTGCIDTDTNQTPSPVPVATITPEPSETPDPVSELINQLGSNNYDIQKSAEKQLLNYGQEIIPVIIKEFKENKNSSIRSYCAKMLGEISDNDKKILNVLLEGINDKDENVRCETVKSICKFKDPDTIDCLIKILTEDPSSIVKSEAAYSLGRIGDKKALYPLFEALKEKDPLVREWAIYGLGLLKEPEAEETLIVIMKEDPEPKVRANAAKALGETGTIDGLRALIETLETDSSSIVRENAAFAIGMIKDFWAIDPLIEALKDPEAKVRANAAYSLGLQENERAVYSLIEAYNDKEIIVREQVIYALRWIEGEEAIKGIEKALKDPEPLIRTQAATYLGEMESKSSLEELKRAAAIEKSEEVKENILKVIEKLKHL